jgi:hypothetical protein
MNILLVHRTNVRRGQTRLCAVRSKP